MRRAAGSGELRFEGLDFGPEHEPAARHDAVDGFPDEGVILGRPQIDEGDGRACAHSAATGDASVT